MLVSGKPALKCLEDTGQNISPLHFGLKWSNKCPRSFDETSGLYLFNVKKLGLGGHFGPDLATGPLFRPMLPASNVELLSKHALSKKKALGLGLFLAIK
jgi:hypothetical protein